jgi:xanthine/CO dehydrogenase XdhC/CoxF family maturation factor
MQYSAVEYCAIQCRAIQSSVSAVPEVMVGRAVEGGCAEEDVAESMAACLNSSNLSHVLHSTFLASADITSVCVWCGAVQG